MKYKETYLLTARCAMLWVETQPSSIPPLPFHNYFPYISNSTAPIFGGDRKGWETLFRPSFEITFWTETLGQCPWYHGQEDCVCVCVCFLVIFSNDTHQVFWFLLLRETSMKLFV